MKPVKSLYKLLAEENEQKRKYFQNYFQFAKKIKEIAQKLLPDAKVLIFGSAIRGEAGPESDLDILIISSKVSSSIFKQAEIKTKIEQKFKNHPFEIHLVTPKEYQNWYQRFIKKDFREV